MRTTCLTFVVICLVFSFAGISQAADIIRVNGSGSGLDMLTPLIEAFRKVDGNVTVETSKPLGSSGAIKALLAGVLDLAVTSRTLKPEEFAKGAKPSEYGKTPLAIIVEKNVQLANITSRELADIYAGKTSAWPNGDIIRLVLRPKEDADTRILRALSTEMDSAMTKAQSRPGMIVAVNDTECITVLPKTTGGIAASGLSNIIIGKVPCTILTLNGVKPTVKNLANNTYPLAKEISFVTTARTSPAALKFLSFVYSPKGRAIAEKAGVLVTSKATSVR
jgi:phosphate transport system substrate-binding protein